MSRHRTKRETDIQIISGWIGDRQRVLDIGCGRGILLEHLTRTHEAWGLGVDTDIDKIQACIKRGVPVYHGDAEVFLGEFPDQFFDWIVLSRLVQDLYRPGDTIRESLRVARNVAIGFVNYGYWLNRWSTLLSGSRPSNEVFPLSWEQGTPYNPVTINGFNTFAQESGIRIEKAVFLRGDWRTPVRFLPNLTAGYALYHLRAPA